MAQNVASTADRRAVGSNLAGQIFSVTGIYGIALLFFALGVLLQAVGIIQRFLTPQNLFNIVNAAALVGIVAAGMAFVTYSGKFADMSVPTTMGFTGYVCIELLRFGFIPAVIGSIAVALLIGLLNGFVIGKLKANPIIWTLAVNYMTMGVIRLIWVNKQIYPDMQGVGTNIVALFDDIYRYRVFGSIGLPVVILAVLVVAGQFVITRTTFGARLKLIGSSLRAAQFTGVHVERLIGAAFVLSALTAAIAGLAVTSLTRVGAWYNGAGYDFKAVTVIVIGGVTLAGGRGSILGVLGGALIIGILDNITTLLGIGTFSQNMIRGAIFIVVVGINAKSLRSLGRDDA